MKIKTSELEGIALDYAVAQCEGKKLGWKQELLFKDALDLVSGVAHSMIAHYRPSSNWRQGGPIIEREMLTVGPAKHLGYMAWAYPKKDGFWGDSPLVAAMRCYVAMKLGNEVEVPDDIIADITSTLHKLQDD